MRFFRRLMLVAVVTALVAAVSYGVGSASLHSAADEPASGGSTLPPATATPSPAGTSDGPTGGTTGPAPSAGEPDPSYSADPTAPPTSEPTDEPASPATSDSPTRAPELEPGPALLAAGDEGPGVRELQARLAQIDWFNAGVTGYYGEVTTAAVRGFQAKREIPVTGEVDRRTLDRLEAMTTEPTDAELHGAATTGNAPGPLDARCRTGRVLCVDKSSNTLRWVVGGDVRLTVDVRFGGAATPTREGVFSVFSKSRDHVSSLYDTSMPFAMFFSGGQAVHYSPDFAAVGYAGASHGCVNVRDYDKIAWLYDQVAIGDKVVVYWS
ncbi:peptidoglycan-binding protein [Nocardioides ferulae]|uniref:peptidoglycan-binding protein n=1 Tax=Nocardioides ferulae TaxID=2340821 RepID=UPI000EB20D16|nr:peptidoglycan-binding protein [Nocardioides ferulae]